MSSARTRLASTVADRVCCSAYESELPQFRFPYTNATYNNPQNLWVFAYVPPALSHRARTHRRAQRVQALPLIASAVLYVVQRRLRGIIPNHLLATAARTGSILQHKKMGEEQIWIHVDLFSAVVL